ncbi:hypothetical protein AgCh_038082 [Apium graveolens]
MLEMSNLVRNSTLRRSKRHDHGFFYAQVDQSREKIGEDGKFVRICSSRKKVINVSKLRTSLSYRRDRARKRQIFLQSYNLSGSSSSEDTSSASDKNRKSKKLKKAADKVKSVAVSVVSFMRISSLRSNKSRFTVRAFFRTRIQATSDSSSVSSNLDSRFP